MSEKSINFDDKKINKGNFCKNKKLFNIHDLDVNKVLVSKKESYGTKSLLKHFTGYNDDDFIRPFLIINLIMNLMDLIMKSLIMKLLMINLKVKIVF